MRFYIRIELLLIKTYSFEFTWIGMYEIYTWNVNFERVAHATRFWILWGGEHNKINYARADLTCKIMKRIMGGFWLKFPLIRRSARSAHWVVSHYDRFLNDSIAQSVGNIWFLARLIHDDWPHRGWYCITDEWFFMAAVRQKIHSRSSIRSHRHKKRSI